MSFENAVVLFGIASVMLIIAIFKPHIALPFCKKRWVALLFWALVVLFSGVMARDLRPADGHLSAEDRYKADLKHLEEVPAITVNDISLFDFKRELMANLYELDEIRHLKDFHAYGFDFPRAKAIELSINKLRAIAKQQNLSLHLQQAPENLLRLVIEWRHLQGVDNADTQKLLENIKQAISDV